MVATLPEIRDKLGVTVQPTTIDGVKAFIVTPKVIPPRNRNRVLVHVHGGAYVLSPGEAATKEAIELAGFGGFKVISVDYRMPPDYPYPAAMDDAMAGVPRGAEDNEAKQCRDIRHIHRRRHDIGDGAARKAWSTCRCLARSHRARRGRI